MRPGVLSGEKEVGMRTSSVCCWRYRETQIGKVADGFRPDRSVCTVGRWVAGGLYKKRKRYRHCGGIYIVCRGRGRNEYIFVDGIGTER